MALANKVAIISGANPGIGWAAKLFAQQGVKLIVVAGGNMA